MENQRRQNISSEVTVFQRGSVTYLLTIHTFAALATKTAQNIHYNTTSALDNMGNTILLEANLMYEMAKNNASLQ